MPDGTTSVAGSNPAPAARPGSSEDRAMAPSGVSCPTIVAVTLQRTSGIAVANAGGTTLAPRDGPTSKASLRRQWCGGDAGSNPALPCSLRTASRHPLSPRHTHSRRMPGKDYIFPRCRRGFESRRVHQLRARSLAVRAAPLAGNVFPTPRRRETDQCWRMPAGIHGWSARPCGGRSVVRSHPRSNPE